VIRSVKTLKVLLIGAECAPFVKVGGLADVLGALPKYISRQGVNAATVVPLYQSIDREQFVLEEETALNVETGVGPMLFRVFKCVDKDGILHYFLEQEKYFSRSNIYGEKDDAERFFALVWALWNLRNVRNLIFFMLMTAHCLSACVGTTGWTSF